MVNLGPGIQYAGEVRQVWQHNQPNLDVPQVFVKISYLVPLRREPPQLVALYDQLPELEVNFWEHGQYQTGEDFGASSLMHADGIAGTAARCTLELEDRKIWVTTGMSKTGRIL